VSAKEGVCLIGKFHAGASVHYDSRQSALIWKPLDLLAGLTAGQN
jgi:hypothetical protein